MTVGSFPARLRAHRRATVEGETESDDQAEG
jgi:hypothetical protein